MNTSISKFQDIHSKIYSIRGIRVMLDRDLAVLYGVTTGNLNKAVDRNKERFPSDFIFQLDKDELENLIFQNGISSWGGTRKLPFAFTEQGVAMLSGILKSKIAVEINIRIMRAFVEIHKMVAIQPEYALLKETLSRIESRMDTIESNHLVDRIHLSGKVTQLSKDSQDIRHEIRRITQLFDEFQAATIIIRRPEEDPWQG